MTIAKPASSELPPPLPSLWYICCPKSGNTNPSNDRNTAAAAIALAAYEKASTRYNWIGRLVEPHLRKN